MKRRNGNVFLLVRSFGQTIHGVRVKENPMYVKMNQIEKGKQVYFPSVPSLSNVPSGAKGPKADGA